MMRLSISSSNKSFALSASSFSRFCAMSAPPQWGHDIYRRGDDAGDLCGQRGEGPLHFAVILVLFVYAPHTPAPVTPTPFGVIWRDPCPAHQRSGRPAAIVQGPPGHTARGVENMLRLCQ